MPKEEINEYPEVSECDLDPELYPCRERPTLLLLQKIHASRYSRYVITLGIASMAGIFLLLVLRGGARMHTSHLPVIPQAEFVVNGDHFVVFPDGSLAQRGNNGSILWHSTTRVSAAPLVTNGEVYVSAEDGSAVALRGNSGLLVWHYEKPGFYSSLLAVVNGEAYIRSQSTSAATGEVVALRGSDGAILWNFETTSHVGMSVVGSSVVMRFPDGGVVVLRGSDGAILQQ